MIRLTKNVRQKLLECNEGFSIRTYYEGRNSREERIYTIANGKLYIKAIGKSSWADSRYEKEWEALDEEIHRFLYKNLDDLNTDAVK